MTANPQRITVLGSTGSIGVSTLNVLSRHGEQYVVHALTANRRIDELFRQCVQFCPEVAVVGTAADALILEKKLRAKGIRTEVFHGEKALCDVAASSQCDAVMAAIVGAAGLAPALAAARAGKKVMLANKEALVMSGQLFIDTVIASGATLLPIDSEHNAIFQCLVGATQKARCEANIILTCSGGPFRQRHRGRTP